MFTEANGLSNAASSTVAKRVLTSGSTDEAASFIFVAKRVLTSGSTDEVLRSFLFTNSRLLITEVR